MQGSFEVQQKCNLDGIRPQGGRARMFQKKTPSPKNGFKPLCHHDDLCTTVDYAHVLCTLGSHDVMHTN